MKPISFSLAVELAPRIMRRVHIDRDGCWIRTVNVNPRTGYTSVTRTRDGQVDYYFAHRVMYVLAHGIIPDGLTIDHLCEKVACCNPLHLRAVTHAENVLRSRTNPFAINARKKTCPQGHELEWFADKRKRRCPTCRKERAAEARRRRYEAGVPKGEPHGTRRAYQYFGCRCDTCMEAQRQTRGFSVAKEWVA